MSHGRSKNQYESSFKPRQLLNWQVPQTFTKYPKSRQGFSQYFADDRGWLLTGAPRSVESPWGTYISSWDMPLKIPPSHPKYTGRLKSEQCKLRNWREKSTLQHHCNGFLHYPTKHSPKIGENRPEHPPPPNTTPESPLDEEVDLTPFEDVRPGQTPGPHGSLSHTGARQLVPEFSRMSVRSFEEDEDGGRMDHVRVGVDSDGAQADRARLRRGQSGMKTRPSLNDRYHPQNFGKERRQRRKSLARNSQVKFTD